jgi:ribose transport system permease protein
VSDMTVAEGTKPVVAGAEPTQRAPRRRPGLAFAERYALLALFVLTIIVFAIWQSDTFPTTANFQNIVSSQAVVAVVALALMIPLVGGNFDISVGSVCVLSSIAMASLTYKHGWPLLPAIVAVVALGMAIGLINGMLVAYGGLDGLIATLGSSFVIGGLMSYYTKDVSITGQGSKILSDIGTQNLLGVPRLAVVAAVVALVVAYVLTQTPVGRRVTAIGSSSPAARLVGIRVERTVLGTFIVSGGVAALAGILMLAQQAAGNPANDGLGLALPALAAVFLGASAFTPGQFNVLGTLVGLLLVAVFVSGLTLAGAQPWVQPVFQGGALIIAVGISAALRRRRLGRGT